jgi:aldehyde dehydrogenase (NAD+)
MPTVKDIFTNLEYGPAPESAAAAQAWLEAHKRQFDLFINNRWHKPSAGTYFETHNPASGDLLAKVADANTADIDAAYQAARAAAPAWAALSGHARARYLYAIARGVQKHARLLAVIETLDNGKTIRESRDIDIPLVARHFYHHAGWAQLSETELAGYQPLGVVGQIIPWNFPLLMLAWKLAPALAMGNTLVLKTAPQTPLTAYVLAEIIAEVGLPAGVVNLVSGGDEAGKAIVAHSGFDKIAFTGSTNVGRIIRRQTAGTGKRLSLELGGKSPYVVFEDADQDGAVEGLVDAIWFNQGEVCCAGSRLLVQESIAPQFIAKLKQRMTQLRIGDPLDKAMDIGAVVDQAQYDTIKRWVDVGISEGAQVYQPELPMPSKGCFFLPTLLTNVTPSATLAQEEIFGPVLVAMTFRTPKEAVALANNTRYGLAASVWTENVNQALDTARKIKAGVVWVNCTNMLDAAAGFGGYRESGFGREGSHDGLHEYLRPAWQARPQPAVNGVISGEAKAWGKAVPPILPAINGTPHNNGTLPALDRTAKLFIGGKQKRPDGNYSRAIIGADEHSIGQVGEGNAKDIRDAVEAAHAAKWADATAHNRAQILYYIAENLSARHAEFSARIQAQTGRTADDAAREVDLAISRWFSYAAWCDKFGGTVQETPMRGLTVSLNEAIGVVGVACPNAYPLLGFTALVAPLIARGNTVIAIPSQVYPLSVTDLYQVFETSDLPAGVVNIVTGDRDLLTKTLAEHEDVDALWYFAEGAGGALGSQQVEALSAVNMKRTWVSYGIARDWADAHQGMGVEFLREATQVKNVWIPMGDGISGGGSY